MHWSSAASNRPVLGRAGNCAELIHNRTNPHDRSYLNPRECLIVCALEIPVALWSYIRRLSKELCSIRNELLEKRYQMLLP